MDRQLTEKEAIAIHDSGTWGDWTDEEIVKLQLFQDRLCVPFGRFHAAVEQVLGRPVWTHEFARVELLREEYLKMRPVPTFKDILAQVPAEKLIIVEHDYT